MRQFLIVLKANLLSTFRNRSAVFFNIFSPVLFFLIFGSIFKNDQGRLTPGGPVISYPLFLLAGIIVVNQLAAGFYGGAVVLVTWRERGIFRRIQVTPTSVWQFILARVLAQMVVVVLQAALVIVMAQAVFGVHPDPDGAGWDIMFILTGALVFLALGQVVAARVKRVETANIIINVIWLPLMFFTNLFIPLQEMPDWLQRIGKVLPPYLVVDLLRSSIITGTTPTNALAEMAGLAIYFVVAILVAARLFQFS
jgi:ABC-2 type transport system permease protein